MTTPRSNQAGFGAFLIIIMLLVLVGLGATEWLFWQRSHRPAATVAAPPPSVTPTPKPAAVHYFTITEWGIRAPYSGNLHLQYAVSDEGGNVEVAPVTSTELTASDAECKDHAGSIIRYASNSTVLPANVIAEQYFSAQDPASYKIINGYYYSYLSPQAQCSTNPAAKKLTQSNEAAIQDIVKHLEVIPDF